MRRILGAAALATVTIGSAAGVDGWRVDQADSWFDPMVSHHGQHGAGGVLIGVVAFEGAALVTDSRTWRYASAIGAGALIGFGYEAEHASATTFNDPVDAAWATVGAAVGAGIADLTNIAIDRLAFAPTPDHRGLSVALAVRW